MALTRLGWDVLTSGSSNRLTNLKWITGKVRAGDAHTILNELGRRFNAEVETIRKDWSWGYAYRNVRGASMHSEHAAGTAVDFNAPLHGLGGVNTFSGAEEKAIKRILKDLDNSVRWGGNYGGRKDEMHFELQGGVKHLARVAKRIRKKQIKPSGTVPVASNLPKNAAPAGRPTDYKNLAVDGVFGGATAEATQILMSQIGLYERAIDGDAGRYTWEAVQEWLNGLDYYNRAVDGSFGYHSVFALQSFLAKKGHLDTKRWLIDGKFGPETVKAFQRYLNTQNGQ
ncbi:MULTISPECIES: M15 family metallopeptidase [Glutamicibacter]|uniref:M15 family metallopeptidase n=1 Tax=Glutamicibacter TaxID=1742989 RepID=UPI00257B5230|nr:M15 family metallopeptidase [Glutamicibacter sp.]